MYEGILGAALVLPQMINLEQAAARTGTVWQSW